jgi:hypothetical protein
MEFETEFDTAYGKCSVVKRDNEPAGWVSINEGGNTPEVGPNHVSGNTKEVLGFLHKAIAAVKELCGDGEEEAVEVVDEAMFRHFSVGYKTGVNKDGDGWPFYVLRDHLTAVAWCSRKEEAEEISDALNAARGREDAKAANPVNTFNDFENFSILDITPERRLMLDECFAKIHESLSDEEEGEGEEELEECPECGDEGGYEDGYCVCCGYEDDEDDEEEWGDPTAEDYSAAVHDTFEPVPTTILSDRERVDALLRLAGTVLDADRRDAISDYLATLLGVPDAK